MSRQKSTYHILYISIIIAAVLYSGTAFGKSVEELILQGDRSFNLEEYQKALKLYQNAYFRSQKETPDSPLLGEILTT